MPRQSYDFADGPPPAYDVIDTTAREQVDDMMRGPGALTPYQPMQMAEADPVISQMMPLLAGRERDYDTLLAKAKRHGSRLGEMAYYNFPMGGITVSGPSVKLVEAIASDIPGLLRKVEVKSQEPTKNGTRVVIEATVLDLIVGNGMSRDAVYTLAPAPGKFRNKPDQIARWEALQLQVALSKAMRSALERVVPAWLIEAGLKAAKDGTRSRYLNGRSLSDAVEEAVAYFTGLGASVSALEGYVGNTRDLWTIQALVKLRELATQIKHGETTLKGALAEFEAEEESPPPKGGMAAGAKQAREQTEQPPLSDLDACLKWREVMATTDYIRIRVKHLGGSAPRDAEKDASPEVLAALRKDLDDFNAPPADEE